MKRIHLILAATAFCLSFLIESSVVEAEEPRYDWAPEATPPYYRVRYEAADTDDGLQFAVQYSVWIPPDVETLR
ncbi:MAG: hypothetical protein AAF745_16840, partial [Planctomycetota bacterium]